MLICRHATNNFRGARKILVFNESFSFTSQERFNPGKASKNYSNKKYLAYRRAINLILPQERPYYGPQVKTEEANESLNNIRISDMIILPIRRAIYGKR